MFVYKKSTCVNDECTKIWSSYRFKVNVFLLLVVTEGNKNSGKGENTFQEFKVGSSVHRLQETNESSFSHVTQS